MMITFENLNENIVDRIYSHMDIHTRKKFSQTSKNNYNLFLKNEKFHQIALFIENNYSVQTNMQNDLPLWIKLKKCQLFLVGENHCKNVHRRIFAEFVHRIWSDGEFHLLLEGSGWSRGIGPTRYLNHEIADTHTSWDLGLVTHEICVEMTVRYRYAIQFVCRLLQLEKEMNLNLFFEKINIVLEELTFTLEVENKENKFKEPILNSMNSMKNSLGIIQNFKSILKDKVPVACLQEALMMTVTFLEKERVAVIFYTSCMIHEFISQQSEKINNRIAETKLFRDLNLLEKIKEFRAKKLKVIAYGGNAHTRIDADPHLGFSLPLEELFLSLTPLESVFECISKNQIVESEEYMTMPIRDSHTLIKEFFENFDKMEDLSELHIWMDSAKNIFFNFSQELYQKLLPFDELVIKAKKTMHIINQDLESLGTEERRNIYKWIEEFSKYNE